MTESVDHPEVDLEANRLQETINHLERLICGTSSAGPIYGHKLELSVRHNGLNASMRLLAQALPSPYFGRFDCL